MIDNIKIPLNNLYVLLGNYHYNRKVRFFISDENFEYYEITNDGLIRYDEIETNYIDNPSIHKLVTFTIIGKKVIPMICSLDSANCYDPFEDIYDDTSSRNLPLTVGISYNNVEPVQIKHYLKKMALNANKNKFIEVKKILECKEILDALCEKSYVKYKQKYVVNEEML